MRRRTCAPRPDWQQRVEAVGLVWHSKDSYWQDGVYYEFGSAEINELERVTGVLHELAIEAAAHVIARRRYADLGIPRNLIPLVEESWEADEPQVYGRLDLWYDGVHDPRLLEYNADTPTGLVEASLAQWDWLEGRDLDQWNSIHEKLVDRWRHLKQSHPLIHFATYGELPEDVATVTYLADTAAQAGCEIKTLDISEVGWNGITFVDVEEQPITQLFKLYPWEWLADEDFAGHLRTAPTHFIEPAWKLLLSSKGLLAIMWELNPDHPNLLATYLDNTTLEAYAEKPMFGREGANVRLVWNGEILREAPGAWGDDRMVYQDLCPLPAFDGNYPVIGTWLVNGWPAGMGIRESSDLITGNTSRFTPHVIAKPA